METQIIIMLVSFALTMLTSSSSGGDKPKKAALEDFDLPVPEEGTPHIVVFGDCWIKDWTVLTFGNLRSSAVRSKSGK